MQKAPYRRGHVRGPLRSVWTGRPLAPLAIIAAILVVPIILAAMVVVPGVNGRETTESKQRVAPSAGLPPLIESTSPAIPRRIVAPLNDPATAGDENPDSRRDVEVAGVSATAISQPAPSIRSSFGRSSSGGPQKTTSTTVNDGQPFGSEVEADSLPSQAAWIPLPGTQ